VATMRVHKAVLGCVLAACFSSGAALAADGDAQQQFEQAMAQREKGNLEAAIKGFQTILSNNPKLQRARLELAVAYFQAAKLDAAKREAEQVLNDPTTPEAVKVNIRRFLAQVAAAQSQQKWRPYVSVGFMYDSNVNVGPGSELVGLPSIAAATAKSDHAWLFNVGVDHRYLPGRGANADPNKPVFAWLTQANYWRTDYLNLNAYDLDVATVSTGPGWFKPGQWRGGVSAEADYVRLGGDYYALFTALNPHFTLIRNGDRTEVAVDGLIQRRDYKRTIDAGRDSNFNSVGLSVGHLLSGDKMSVQGGLRVFKEDADSNWYSNNGQEVFVGANYRKSERTNFYGRVTYRNQKYKALDPAYAYTAKRKDHQYLFVAGVNHMLTSGFMRGWVAKGNVTLTRHHSNQGLYGYNRDQIAVSLERSFK
jgi:tetratricopeptide (TPR) repeat protein